MVVFLVTIFGATGQAFGQDTTPPDLPAGVFVQQGTDWQADDGFDLWWINPVQQETPIAVVHYELCPVVPFGACATHQVAGPDIAAMSITVPYVGWFWFRLWLEDAAGNVDSTAKSEPVMLRFDDQLPPAPRFQTTPKWINGAEPNELTVVIEIDPAGSWPLSGIKGYSVSLDGSVPDQSIEAWATLDHERFPAEYLIAGLAEGVSEFRMRSVSYAGLMSEEFGVGFIRIDRSPPLVAAEGLPEPGSWTRQSVDLRLKASDQLSLSGMTMAPNDQPVENGAYLAYEINGGPPHKIRDYQTQVPVTSDGHHAVTYEAFDAAGNPSGKEKVQFKIDQTAPGGGFVGQDPGDPRQLRVDVFDATSGVADGHIEYRREGEGRFERLPTRLEGGQLLARIDDIGMAAGRYEFRAVVRDVAGNEGVIAKRTDGSAMTLALPVRELTRLEVSAVATSGKSCGKARKRGKAKRRAKSKRALAGRARGARALARPRRRGSTHARRVRSGHERTRRKRTKPGCQKKAGGPPSGGKALSLPHGGRGKSAGRLTSPSGAPIAGAEVTVEGQLRSGGPFVRVGAARTDARGSFAFAIPAGASRTIRYRYDGSNTVRPSTAQLATKVKAAARLAVNRRRLLNGQTVRFRGRLPGKPIPSAGKLVALQARVGREWRTFATPRANSKGVFKHRYRFTATTGLRRYAFRALVAREAAYPYERGVSRTVHVIVRGR